MCLQPDTVPPLNGSRLAWIECEKTHLQQIPWSLQEATLQLLIKRFLLQTLLFQILEFQSFH